MRMLTSRAFVRLLQCCALVGTVLSIFLVVPFLVEQVQRFSITSALHARFGERFHYDDIVSYEEGWKLKNVHVETDVARISCSECFLNLRSFPVTLADITAEADVLWFDPLLPPCRIQLTQGFGSLIDGSSHIPLLTWTPSTYTLHDLPCRIALPLLHFLIPHHPLESWSAESGTLSGHLHLADLSVDLTMNNLSLNLMHTPFYLIVKEGRWRSTPEALYTGSAELHCSLSTDKVHFLDIPKEAWNLSIGHDLALVTFHHPLNNEPLALEIQFPLHHTSASGLHFQMNGTCNGKALEAWTGHLHIDKETLTISDLDGYLSGIHFTGNITYSPLKTEDTLSLHLTSASGKISAFQQLLKDSPSFRFLSTLPCEGYAMLSQEGATFTWSPLSSLRYQLSGSLMDLTLLGAEDSMTTHDLSCQWRYDSTRNSLDLYNLHGTLIVENGTPLGESYLLKSDLLCSLDNHCPKMAFDFWVGNRFTEKMVRLAGEVTSELGEPFVVACCPERTHFGSAHPTQCLFSLNSDGSLQSMNLKLPLQLEESFDLLQRISRIPYCTIDPLFTKWLQRLQKVQGDCDLSFNYHKEHPTLHYRLQSNKLILDNQELRACLIEGQLNRQQCVIDTLQANGCQLSASLTKTDTGWKIPYLAFQYTENLLVGFEGHFTSATHTLEGTLPLFTWNLPSSTLYPPQVCWTGNGRLTCHALFGKDFSFALSLKGNVKPPQESFFHYLPPLSIQLKGNQELLQATIVPEGEALHWPIRPFDLTLQRTSNHYLLQGSLKDPTYPIWVEACMSDLFELPTQWSLYDVFPSPKPPLTIQKSAQNSEKITLKGGLWEYTCDLCYDLHQHSIEGLIAWKTLQGSTLPPPLLRTPLHALPLQASWQLTGKGSLPLKLEGTLSVSNGLLHGFPLPAWKAKIHWHPPLLELCELLTLDPHLACTLQKLELTSGSEKTFKLTGLTAQEKPLCKSKERLSFPWHPHVTFPFLEIASLEGSLTPPYCCTGEGSLQFHRPSTQKRIASDDPLYALIPLPDVLTPRQGTLMWSVCEGEWQIKEIKHAYSEGKLVEFLLVPSRPAHISKTGEIDITLQARPAKHKLRAAKHIFHLQGPIWQPSCVQLGKEQSP